MSIYFASDQITIYRQRRISNTNRYSMSATFTVYGADIQPQGNPDRIEMANSRFGAVYVGYVDVNVDIKEGDQVVTDNRRYSVKGVQTWQGSGLLDHKELTLVSEDGTN